MKNLIIIISILFSINLSAQDIWIGIGEKTYRSNILISDVTTFFATGGFDNNPFIIGMEFASGNTSRFGLKRQWNNFSMIGGVRAIEFRNEGTEWSVLSMLDTESIDGKFTAMDLGLGTSLTFKIINQIHFKGVYQMSALRYSRNTSNEWSRSAFSGFNSYSLGLVLKLTQNAPTDQFKQRSVINYKVD